MKKAHLVELHDAGVIVHPYSYPDGVVGWNECLFSSQWIFSGEHISHLVKALGPDVSLGWYEDVWSEKDGCVKRQWRDLAREGLKIQHQADVVGSGHCSLGFGIGSHKIGELWAQVVAPRRLRLRFTTLWEQDGKEHSHTIEVEYCGNFTVWWAAEPTKEEAQY